jgi:hypothetical protein
MDTVLAGLKWSICCVYLDDILIFSPSWEKHLVDVGEVLKRLSKLGFSIEPQKCWSADPKLRLLGHVVGE